MAKVNEICKDCLKWKRFGKECWVWWDRKKDCSQRITSNEDWLETPSL